MKWKNLFVILAFLAVLLPSWALAGLRAKVEWLRTYEGLNIGWAMGVDSSNNIYVAGESNDDDITIKYNGDYVTIKYDVNGNELWVKKYDGGFGGSNDTATALVVDSLDNVYVTGRSIGSNGYDYATVKYDADGNELWVKRYDSGYTDNALAIALDSSDNVYVTGSGGFYWIPGSSDRVGDYVTIKYAPDGTELWVRTYDGGYYEVATALAVDSSGNAYVTGYGRNTYEYATIKYDTNGNELWVRRYNGGSNDLAYAIAVDSAGNVYVSGWSRGSSGSDYATIKYDTNGNELWVRRYDNGDDDIFRALSVDSSGNVYVTGGSYATSSSGIRISHFATIKYDTNGNELWVKRSGDDNTGGPRSLTLDSSGNVYVTGGSYSSASGYDYATIKYDTNGNQIWVKFYDGTLSESVYGIVVDLSTNVYVTGQSCTSSTCDIVTIKYSQSQTPTTPNEVVSVVEEMLATGEITNNGFANAIITKLNEAQAFLDAGDTVSARSKLEETIVLIQNQTGNHIKPRSATELISYINDIIAGL
jgi:predicted Rdx family selenoprotein